MIYYAKNAQLFFMHITHHSHSAVHHVVMTPVGWLVGRDR